MTCKRVTSPVRVLQPPSNPEYTCLDNSMLLPRIAFSVLRLDAYLAALFNQPPSILYQELRIPLPKSSQLCLCSTDDKRRRLQWEKPAGREQALFSYFMSDALAEPEVAQQRSFPYRFTALDRHLGLCALQSGCRRLHMKRTVPHRMSY